MHTGRTWLTDLQQLLVHGDDAVLITVARTEGTTPREIGTKMIVSRDRTFDTIGGGQLEWRTIDIARRLLRDGGPGNYGVRNHANPAAHAGHLGHATSALTDGVSTARQIERLSTADAQSLPHSGMMTLTFERLTIADLGWVTSLAKRYAAGQATVRSVSFADDSPVVLSDAPIPAQHTTPPGIATGAAAGGAIRPDCLLWDAGPLLTETIVVDPFPIMVFGAGHVGSALIQVLATLPCDVAWIDDRPGQFALSGDHSNVTAYPCDHPAAMVANAPAGCSFVVMTYSDTLDQDIAEQVLRRADYAYLGVIGSHAKRRNLEHLYAARGIDPSQIARMHCPIGIHSVRGSAPEVMAISVAADLLYTREQRPLPPRVLHEPDLPSPDFDVPQGGTSYPY